MIEPRRLRDEAESAVELMLLDAGVSYRTSPDTRAKTLAALGLAGTAAVTVGAVSIAASSLKVGWSKLLLISGLSAGVVAPAGYVAWNHFHTPAPTAAAAPVAQAPANARPAAPAPRALVDEVPAVVDQPPASVKPESKTSSASALAAELGALDAVRARLSSGDASGALAKLDEYARTYPRGRLVLEAEVLRIDALAKNGQHSAAKKRAESFLTRHPKSVLASRVRGYLD
jgi:TolA-binding protein